MLQIDPQQAAISNPPGSRLFIVCGRAVEEATLQAAFAPFGTIQNIKLIKEKGVCYVKYDRASSAAAAMESLNGAVLNNGRGPKLKVLLAEAPTPRGVQAPPKLVMPDEAASADPDNVPPRSRLFLVVPKTAEARLVHEELSRYPDMEYCKTDLIASKGCVFVKYAKASSALRALEEVAAKGMLGTYKVKVMLAEPKTKRARPELNLGLFGAMGGGPLAHLQGLGLDPAAAAQFGAFGLGSANTMLAAQQAAALQAAAAAGGAGGYGQLQSLMGFDSAQNMAAVAAAAAAAAAGAPGGAGHQGMDPLGGQMGLAAFGGLGHQGQFMPGLTGAAADQAAAAAAAAAAMGSGGVPPPHSHMGAAHQQHAAAAAAAAAAAGGGGGGFPSASAAHHGMGGVSSGLPSMNFGQLGPFMGLNTQAGMAPGPPQHSSSGGLMTSAAMQQMHHMGAAAAQHQQHDQQHHHALRQQLGGPPLSQQRLFVVVHKSVSEDQLRLLFRQYPGCEYCDLKRDKLTGRSKGYCYVNYSTPAAAAAALADLDGVEYPVNSGFRLKVMYAEIMGGSNNNNASSSSHSGNINSSNPAAAALLRSSSSRSSLSGPHQGGGGGGIMRDSSGNLSLQHGHNNGSSGALAAAAGGSAGSLGGGPGSSSGLHAAAQVVSAGAPPMSSVVTPVGAGIAGGAGGSTAGSSAVLLSPAASDPHSGSSAAPVLAAGGVLGSSGPSPSASPLCDAHAQAHAMYHHQQQQKHHQHHHQQHQQQQQQNDLARVTDRLSSLSLPNMSAPSPQHNTLVGSMGSEHSNDLAVAAAAAAAAQHFSDAGANMAANTVARELMFNMG